MAHKIIKKSLTVSVVVPAFNEEKQIAGCLKSLAAQTIAPHEVLVVDNNSTDKTVELVKSFRFVTLVKEPQQGIVYARNAGANKATGDLIAQIDSDTNVPEDWVEKILQIAATITDKDAVTGPCKFRVKHFSWILFRLHRLVYFWSSWVLMGHGTLFGSNMFMTRSNWLRIRDNICLRTDIHEDMDWATHIILQGGKIYFKKDFWATISPRRWSNALHYPKMWLNIKTVHKNQNLI